MTQETTKIYQIPSPEPGLEILLGTTPEIRRLLHQPEVVGSRFASLFSLGLKSILSTVTDGEWSISKALKELPLDVFYILRGGLNFDLHNHLASAAGFPEVSFCSSQRVIEQNKFYNEESGYCKWNLHDSSVLCIGDISATGTTFRFIIENAIQQYIKEGKAPRRLLLVSIGTNRLMRVASELLNLFRNKFGDAFEAVTILYLEGVFSLKEGTISYDEINLDHTDFFVKQFPRSYELELERLRCPSTFLERCVIYDGGSRSFEPGSYRANLLKYWTGLRQLSGTINTENFLADRSDILLYKDQRNWSLANSVLTEDPKDKRILFDVGAATIERILSTGIKELCDQRIQALTT